MGSPDLPELLGPDFQVVQGSSHGHHNLVGVAGSDTMFFPLGSFHSLTRDLGSWLTSRTEAEVIWEERQGKSWKTAFPRWVAQQEPPSFHIP